MERRATPAPRQRLSRRPFVGRRIGERTRTVPAQFPPTDLDLGPTLVDALEDATLSLGKLVRSTEILPDPDLFVYMYVRREAVLSSQIEGTEASLVDLLEHEAETS